MINNAFVFVVCGEQHKSRLNTTLKFLKRFSTADIIIVGRDILQFDCNELISVQVPSYLDDHQASIYLKTSLHKILELGQRKICYLDNDVIAVNENVDSIFSKVKGPISFANDNCTLRQFSRYAVNCNCVNEECEHLHEAIRKEFAVNIRDKGWKHWNGGVFVFDENSIEFMETWHAKTLSIFSNPYWQTRDQGTLAATVWKLKLQKHPVLPCEFNYVVDPFRTITRTKRNNIPTRKYYIDKSYSLKGKSNKLKPFFLHFINGGIGKRGWKNWDEAEKYALTKKLDLEQMTAPCVNRAPLSEDNRIVHSLWIGQTLTKMELLTINSFLRHGHEFHLWVYEHLQTPIPKEVIIEDANEIIPKDQIFKKTETDLETGVGKGSYSSPFSDLFRYKLLYEKGGYWVDMDVTCLKPFDFKSAYVFRPHRVGVVGNILKCPPRSTLMKMVYEEVARQASQHSEWLMANRVLSKAVHELGLSVHIQTGIWNEESWWDDIRPLVLGTVDIPSTWYGIHWINEFWRILKETGGYYKGRRLFEVVPDKDKPNPGSTLARLYVEYGLISYESKMGLMSDQKPVFEINKPAERQPTAPHFVSSNHINILLPSLIRGGAERSVLEILGGLHSRNVTAKLFVFYNARPCYPFEQTANIKIYLLNGMDMTSKLQVVAAEVLASPNPVLFTHMVKAQLLKFFWDRDIKTIPVIQNSRKSWQDHPKCFNHSNVPFVAAVSDAVAQQLRKSGCQKSIVVVRHELQRWFNESGQMDNRNQIRDRYGIKEGTMLIGMIGEFKSQKCYNRAILVLAQIKKLRPAKLMILGGWDHEWGSGRQAYTDVYRLALELDLVADLITPGSVPDVDIYFAAFDVFLNTSDYEGLSVALLEAINSGCPIVTAKAGGNCEVLPDHAVLVDNASVTSDYVNGINKVMKYKARVIANKPEDFDLIPLIWVQLGRYYKLESNESVANRENILLLTDNLNIGGAQRSLVNLLCNLPTSSKIWLGVLETVYCQNFLNAVENSGVSIFSLRNERDYLDRLEKILYMIESLKVHSVCFWNVDARLKLLLAKILPKDSIRLIDVSPGPFMFIEMERNKLFQRRISFSATEYWDRLDWFVAKYKDQKNILADMKVKPSKIIVIPNGVPIPSITNYEYAPLPKDVDPNLVIGTTCRITPKNRLEYLIDMMEELNRRLPNVTLIIVGGADPRHSDYLNSLKDLLHTKQINNIRFVGPNSEVTSYLRLFKVFVMIAKYPGCPNASLEAMAMGIPVVANAAGGTVEQIQHGKNGLLLFKNDPREMAGHVHDLLVNKKVRNRFGAAAKNTVRKHFSMSLMVQRYRTILERSRQINRDSSPRGNNCK